MTTVSALPESIRVEDHRCAYTGCTGTIWTHCHSGDYDLTKTTGRSSDVIDGLGVTVVATYDEREDTRPRILLHFGAESDRVDVDVDVSPTPAQARRIAIKLLAAADMVEKWAAR